MTKRVCVFAKINVPPLVIWTDGIGSYVLAVLHTAEANLKAECCDSCILVPACDELNRNGEFRPQSRAALDSLSKVGESNSPKLHKSSQSVEGSRARVRAFSQFVSFYISAHQLHPGSYVKQAAEVEGIIKRIASHKGVEGIVICNYDGVALKSTLSRELTAKYASMYSQLALKSRGTVRSIDPEVRVISRHDSIWL